MTQIISTIKDRALGYAQYTYAESEDALLTACKAEPEAIVILDKAILLEPDVSRYFAQANHCLLVQTDHIVPEEYRIFHEAHVADIIPMKASVMQMAIIRRNILTRYFPQEPQ